MQPIDSNGAAEKRSIPDLDLPDLLALLRHLASRGLSSVDVARAAIALELRARLDLNAAAIARKLRLSVPAIERLLAAGDA